MDTDGMEEVRVALDEDGCMDWTPADRRVPSTSAPDFQPERVFHEEANVPAVPPAADHRPRLIAPEATRFLSRLGDALLGQKKL